MDVLVLCKLFLVSYFNEHMWHVYMKSCTAQTLSWCTNKSCLPLLQEHLNRRSNQQQTLLGLNQIWNAINIAYLCGQMIWGWRWHSRDAEEKGITIGWHESAWLADGVGACLPDNSKSHFRKINTANGLHRDDSMTVFNNKLSSDNILKGRTKFQNSANRLAGGNHQLFTCSMWLDQ